MNDWPTHPSILTWKLLISTQGFGPLNSFLTTGTTITRPGLSPTVITPLTGVVTNGMKPPASGKPTPGATPALPAIVTPLDVLMSIPQPISYPTSRTPRGCSPPFSEPANVPLARYSRDETAVVNGGIGICASSFAPRLRVHPSGVSRVTGSAEGTCPSAGGAGAAPTGSASGSALFGGAVVNDMTRQTATTAARRTTTAIGVTRVNIRIA